MASNASIRPSRIDLSMNGIVGHYSKQRAVIEKQLTQCSWVNVCDIETAALCPKVVCEFQSMGVSHGNKGAVCFDGSVVKLDWLK